MIFGTIQLIIWLAGVAAITYFALPHFGYQVNLHYWNEQKAVCQEKLEACQRDLIKTGTDGAKEKCDFTCLDTKALIQKIEQPEKSQPAEVSESGNQ